MISNGEINIGLFGMILHRTEFYVFPINHLLAFMLLILELSSTDSYVSYYHLLVSMIILKPIQIVAL